MCLLARLVIAVACCFGWLCNHGHAGLFFDFEEEGTGTVFATLEVSSLPASHNEIVALTFSPAGEARFYFGPVYPGDFDVSEGVLMDDGMGGLFGSDLETRIIDGNPPPFTPPGFITPVQFVISAGPLEAGSLDQLLVDWDAPVAGPGFFYVDGNWRRVVPEPSALSLAVALLLILAMPKYCRNRAA